MFADMDFWFPDLNTPEVHGQDQVDGQNNVEDLTKQGHQDTTNAGTNTGPSLRQFIKTIQNLHVYKKTSYTYSC
jgi:alpha-D-ribose 1-methylphosphonate 5-phosphate C-P lyase